MYYFTLRKHSDNAILFDGRYNTFTECLEDAVNKNISLPHIDLRNRNLVNANIDNAFMPYADFSNSNLSGANISEAILRDSKFTDTSLYNCCMSYSDLRNCDFTGAGFGGTLIDNTNLENCTFSTLSCFDLDFVQCLNMENCSFIEPNNKLHSMSTVPVVIKGLLNTPIIIFDNNVKIGNKTIKRDITPQLLNILSTYTYQQMRDSNKAA
ncbi:MAG: pentapeptide repeat-containing protein [Alphaproteobacteria bacterium]|nr:pentapeptide repeat-containing protein [Alphaproteobacteria bacterium]